MLEVDHHTKQELITNKLRAKRLRIKFNGATARGSMLLYGRAIAV